MHELKAFDSTFMKLATYSTDQTTLQDKINNLNSNHEKSVPMRVEFVRLKSYENTESAGEVQIVGVSSEELVNLKVQSNEFHQNERMPAMEEE